MLLFWRRKKIKNLTIRSFKESTYCLCYFLNFFVFEKVVSLYSKDFLDEFTVVFIALTCTSTAC